MRPEPSRAARTARTAPHVELTGLLRGAWRRATEVPQLHRHPSPGPILVAMLIATAVPLALAGAAIARSETAVTDTPQRYDAQSAPGRRHEQAVQAYREGRHADAFGRFAELADQGHAPSALMALVMVRHGAWMYGSEWSATPGQLRRWASLALFDLGEQAPLLARHDRGE